MPTTRRQRTINAGVEAVWEVVGDPYHFPRWWPKVGRVEAVHRHNWTKVYVTRRGRPIRADYRLGTSEPRRRRVWTQDLEGSPFERVMRESTTEVRLEPEGPEATMVTIELRQRMKGFSRLGGFMVRRATRRLLDEALEGLSAACER